MVEYNMTKPSEKKITIFAKDIRKKILDLSFYAGSSSSHFGGALSSADIVACLFGEIMNFDKKNFQDPSRDRFILSKGHGCMVYYAVLNILGIISDEKLKTFEKNNSDLLGHPVKNNGIGIDFSTGSLGMGLSLGIGLSLAFKKKETNNRVFVLVGDGECNEGSIWESALCAPNLKLNNLTVIIDYNNFQQTGPNDEIMSVKNLEKKWSSFNWNTTSVDGHNIDQITEALKVQDNEIPRAIIAKTIKGKGFSFSENNNDWHHKVMTSKNYHEALDELSKND
jgi:transketolase